jgi:hypothetical protein
MCLSYQWIHHHGLEACKCHVAPHPAQHRYRMHCPENLKQIFPKMKRRGHVPNFYIHVFVRELYIYSHHRSAYLLYCVCGPIVGILNVNRSQINECRNWERGRAISILGIFVSNFRDGAFAVCHAPSIYNVILPF